MAILLYDILTEAKKKPTVIKPDKPKSKDYADPADDVNADEGSDYTDDTTDTTADDTETDATDYTDEEKDVEPTADPTDDTGDTGDEGTDYADSGDTSGDTTDDSTDTGDTGDSPEDIADLEKNISLIKDFLEFYALIKGNIERLSSLKKSDLTISSIINRVTLNLGYLETIVFHYIYRIFNSKSYVENLYQYQCFIQAFKINIEIVKKIKDLDNR